MGAFLELGWTPKYAGPNAIIGYTPAVGINMMMR
jgi:hypothetical protein